LAKVYSLLLKHFAMLIKSDRRKSITVLLSGSASDESSAVVSRISVPFKELCHLKL